MLLRRGRSRAMPDLVLLRVEVLLAARLHRDVLAELEAAVDAVAGAERRREHQADLECRQSAMLQELVQDVRRIGEQVRAEVLVHVRLRQLGEVLVQLRLRVAPREVGVRLREAELGEVAHHLRPGERLGQEDDVGIARLHVGDHPLPEAERLGVRVVDAEDAHALLDPEVDDRAARARALPVRPTRN